MAGVVRASAPHARVTGFPDAGYFADLKNVKGEYEYRGYYQTADSTCWNSTASGGTNAACLKANPIRAASGAETGREAGTGTAWKCLMAEYLMDYIETPMYVMNAAFDVYQVQHILDVGCVPSKCSQAQISAMVGYRKDYLSSSIAHLSARAREVGHGAFIDSCLVHEQNVDYCSGGNQHAYNCAGWLNTLVMGATPQQSYSAWYFGRAAQNISIDPAAAIAPAQGSNPTCPWSFPSTQTATATTTATKQQV